MRMIRAIPALPVIEMKAAVAFYRDKLGFEAVYPEGGFARLPRSVIRGFGQEPSAVSVW